jgi:hypothetical protein
MNIVDKLVCRVGGREVFRAELGTGIAANPYLVFTRRGGERRGGVEWSDDRGEKGRASAPLECGLGLPRCCSSPPGALAAEPHCRSRCAAASSSRVPTCEACRPTRSPIRARSGSRAARPLWEERRGSAQVACASCHGKAAASMKGVAVRYPKHDGSRDAS